MGGPGHAYETQRPNHWWSLHTTNQGVDSHKSLAPRRGQPGVKSSNGELLSSPESKRATMHHIHPRTTPTNTSYRSVCRFGDMCKSARCPWYHPSASGTTRQPQGDAGSDMLPPRRRTPAAMSMPAEKEKEPEIGRNTSSKAIGHKAAPHTAVRRAPTGHTTIHKGTMRCEHCSNHQMRRTPSEPSANPPPLPPSTRCPRTPQGRNRAPARREVPATGVATGL